MSEPLVTQAQLEGLLRRMRRLEERVGRSEVVERLNYEEGTYTPTYLGGTTVGVTTYSLQQGSYVRIGNVVLASGAVVWTAATGTGNAQVSLPFAAATGINFSGSIRLVNVTFAAGTPQVGFSSTQQFFVMRSPATNAAGTIVAVEAAGDILFTIAYLIDG